MMFCVLYSDLVGPSADDMCTGESQSIGESVLTHDEVVGPKAYHSSFDDDQLMKL